MFKISQNVFRSHKVSLRGEKQQAVPSLDWKNMSEAHDVPRSCDTQSLIDKAETKILGLGGP